MKKTYRGSCHCGAVRFDCDADLSLGTSLCNCSICTKTRFWKAIVGAGDLRLLAGQEALSDYQFGHRHIHHFFCRTCGVKPFGRGEIEEIGTFYAINVACLDDLDPADLEGAPVTCQDGRHDAWDRAPADTRLMSV